jgi:hypothetical protein
MIGQGLLINPNELIGSKVFASIILGETGLVISPVKFGMARRGYIIIEYESNYSTIDMKYNEYNLLIESNYSLIDVEYNEYLMIVNENESYMDMKYHEGYINVG